MKIERDKWYLTRGGDKRRVVCVDAAGAYPVVSVGEGVAVTTHTADGSIYDDGERHEDGLVAEYREPTRVWVNIFADGSNTIHHNAEDAAEDAACWSPGPERIAVEFVEVVK